MLYDICIIGGGIIGCGIARELSRFDLRILLLEKGSDVASGCTKANSGIVHGGYSAAPGTVKARFSYRGNQLYELWNQDLHFGIDRCTSLVIAFTSEEKADLSILLQNAKKNGIPNLSILDPKQVLSMEPQINPRILAALHCPHSGIISPYEAAIALAENAASNGVEFMFQHEVQALQPQKDMNTSLWLIQCKNEEYRARMIINCAGVYSDTVAAMSGITQYRILPRKGNYYIFKRDYQPLQRIIFHTPTKKGKGVLVTPTYHGNLMIGPDSQQVDDKDDTIPDEKGLQYIVEKARLTLPDLNMDMVLRSFAGIRPTLPPHNDFVIDNSLGNCIHLLGIDSPGLTSAPCIAQHIVEKVGQHLPLTKRSDFTATRTPYTSRQRDKVLLPMKEVVALAKLAPGTPERIVCQCEQVREKHIAEAMQKIPKPRTVDAIKRRTRASQGYCQGKICRPRILAMLASTSKKDENPARV